MFGAVMLAAFVDSAVRRACEWLARGRPSRTFHGGDGSPYLTRYALFGDLGSSGRKLYLHRFHRGDEDRELHNHPWSIGVSLILAGGYREERLVGLDSQFRDVRPGCINVIWPSTFHRVTMLGTGGWSLIYVGPKVQDWGFLDRATSKFIPARDFIRAKGLTLIE